MKKTNHKINVIKQIKDAVNIVGNHPNQNPDRVFLYINYDMHSFEDSFDEIFSISELESEDFCLIRQIVRLLYLTGKNFVGYLSKVTQIRH